MKPRFLFVLFLVKIGSWIHSFGSALGSLILILSKPKDLEELVRRQYQRSVPVETLKWRAQVMGLMAKESHFVTKYLEEKKRCLVFASGAGRESFSLAKMGFEVTGIDSSPPLIEAAKKYASLHSLNCRFEVRDIFEGPSSTEKYDVLFMTRLLYSFIPTRRRRTGFLRKARTFLADNGLIYLDFMTMPFRRRNLERFQFKRKIAALCNGNTDLEDGDTYYWIANHFMHIFSDFSEVLSEIEESGLDVVENNFENGNVILTVPH